MCTHCSVSCPGTTHLLIASSSTPGAVPSFLVNMIPQICETLLALDVSANFLGALPPALSMCHSLEELNIASNPLRALPSFLSNLSSLRVLIADATGVHTLPDSLTSLEKLHTLSVRRNRMHSLPGWLCLLASLETLLVDGNPFQGPWKALVEPLLTKVIQIPNSPLYPPSTPGFPSAAGSITSVDTDTDTEDFEQSPNVGLNSVPPEDEDHTMTPARAQLERATTSPYPLDTSSRSAGGGLTRNRTTPNRAYYEKTRSPLSSPDPDGPQSAASDKAKSGYLGEREVRRMKSATELRETKSQGPSPSRPTYTHYATSLSSSNLLMTNSPQTMHPSPPLEMKVPPKRFASLGVTGSPTRGAASRSRPPLSNTGWDTVLEEEHSAGPSSSTSSTFTAASNPPTPPQRRSLVKPRPPSSPGDDFERRLRKEEKDKSSRWGFLKKMSMGKMKPDVPPRQERPQFPFPSPQTHYSGRPQTSPGPPSINVLIPTTSMLDSPPRTFGAPRILERKASSDALTNFPTDSFKRTPSTDALKDLPPIHSNLNPPPTTSLVPPPSGPTPRASKRRSFLPIDLSLQESNLSPITPSTFSGGDQSDSRTTPSPQPSTVEIAESFQRREEERAREFYTRALRSVMAYLRDMHDLSQSQLNVLSVYGPSTPDLNNSRSRRPMTSDGNRGISEHFISSVDSSSQLRSADTKGASRNGTDQTTTSTIVVDSTGSVEEKEKQAKADRGKRVRIVREIVEWVSPFSLWTLR
jgi:hypothetical protein